MKILTDEELYAEIRKQPADIFPYTGNVLVIARWVEAAILTKLAEQEDTTPNGSKKALKAR